MLYYSLVTNTFLKVYIFSFRLSIHPIYHLILGFSCRERGHGSHSLNNHTVAVNNLQDVLVRFVCQLLPVWMFFFKHCCQSVQLGLSTTTLLFGLDRMGCSQFKGQSNAILSSPTYCTSLVLYKHLTKSRHNSSTREPVYKYKKVADQVKPVLTTPPKTTGSFVSSIYNH